MSEVERIGSGKRDPLIWLSRLLAALMILAAVAVSLYALFGGLQMEVEFLIEGGLIISLLVVCYSIVGGLILARYPRHIVGWLLLALSGVFLSSVFAAIPNLLAENGSIDPTDLIVRVAAWITLWIWIPQFTLPTIFRRADCFPVAGESSRPLASLPCSPL